MLIAWTSLGADLKLEVLRMRSWISRGWNDNFWEPWLNRKPYRSPLKRTERIWTLWKLGADTRKTRWRGWSGWIGGLNLQLILLHSGIVWKLKIRKIALTWHLARKRSFCDSRVTNDLLQKRSVAKTICCVEKKLPFSTLYRFWIWQQPVSFCGDHR